MCLVYESKKLAQLQLDMFDSVFASLAEMTKLVEQFAPLVLPQERAALDRAKALLDIGKETQPEPKQTAPDGISQAAWDAMPDDVQAVIADLAKAGAKFTTLEELEAEESVKVH